MSQRVGPDQVTEEHVSLTFPGGKSTHAWSVGMGVVQPGAEGTAKLALPGEAAVPEAGGAAVSELEDAGVGTAAQRRV